MTNLSFPDEGYKFLGHFFSPFRSEGGKGEICYAEQSVCQGTWNDSSFCCCVAQGQPRVVSVAVHACRDHVSRRAVPGSQSFNMRVAARSWSGLPPGHNRSCRKNKEHAPEPISKQSSQHVQTTFSWLEASSVNVQKQSQVLHRLPRLHHRVPHRASPRRMPTISLSLSCSCCVIQTAIQSLPYTLPCKQIP